MENRRIAHYDILEKIGAGGMGEVFRARDTKLERDVAIKIIPPAYVTDPERLFRFEREAKLLAALNHTNIAAIYGFEEEGENRFLIMEMVEGESARWWGRQMAGLNRWWPATELECERG